MRCQPLFVLKFHDISDYREAARAWGDLTPRATGIAGTVHNQEGHKKQDGHPFVYEDAIPSSSRYESRERSWHDGLCVGSPKEMETVSYSSFLMQGLDAKIIALARSNFTASERVSIRAEFPPGIPRTVNVPRSEHIRPFGSGAERLHVPYHLGKSRDRPRCTKHRGDGRRRFNRADKTRHQVH